MYVKRSGTEFGINFGVLRLDFTTAGGTLNYSNVNHSNKKSQQSPAFVIASFGGF